MATRPAPATRGSARPPAPAALDAPGEVGVTGESARFVDQQASLGDHLPLALTILAVSTLTIIRALLVPSLMKLFGERNWWAPRPLRRLHERLRLAEGAAA